MLLLMPWVIPLHIPATFLLGGVSLFEDQPVWKKLFLVSLLVTYATLLSTAKKKKNGVHILGQASDILISGERAMLLFEKAHQIGFSGIGLSQRGDHAKRFVHLDTKLRKALWSY